IVKGRVVDEEGRGIANADIVVKFLDGPGTPSRKTGRVAGRGRTSKDGTFAIESVQPASWLWLAVERDGFVMTLSDLFSLSSGESVTRPDLVLARGGAVVGRVTDAAGKPVASTIAYVLKSSDAENA